LPSPSSGWESLSVPHNRSVGQPENDAKSRLDGSRPQKKRQNFFNPLKNLS
jgi:hypothetical protein